MLDPVVDLAHLVFVNLVFGHLVPVQLVLVHLVLVLVEKIMEKSAGNRWKHRWNNW